MIEFNANTLSDLSAATSREWLETNGLGGFSSSTIIGLNTRRYHGLLTAATKPPVGRTVTLSKLEEVLVIDGIRYELSANQYPGVVHPQGYKHQTGFRLDPFPVFTYEVAGFRLEKSLFMVQGENTAIITYELGPTTKSKTSKIELELRPLIAFRDYHSTTHENSALDPHVTLQENLVSITPYKDQPTLFFAHNAAAVDINGFWYRNFQYKVEQERGLDFVEDLFSPFRLSFDLTAAEPVHVVASLNQHAIANAGRLREAEINRRKPGGPVTALVQTLTTAADQFIVARGQQKTIIAGYHWFSDWGRDTMIALPGLVLTTGQYEIAKDILLQFATHVDQGMLPNRFPDAGETPEYNTVDATLWFFAAVRDLVERTGDYDFVRARLYSVLVDIIDWHIRGTRYNIHVDTDGLLQSGAPGTQLTWMDAKIGDWVVTPRHGKPVEIQALWYNALQTMKHFAGVFGDAEHASLYAELARRACNSFNDQFWNADADCLYDVVNGPERDGSIRPNQLFAISLKYPLVSKERASAVLRRIDQELLTPRGLRTLSPFDPNYRGTYQGDSFHRDSVYHQGTVWPWLIGPYLTAVANTSGLETARTVASRWLADFEPHLTEACLGQVSEIFDGDAPHAPRGCVAQAWSVAEILRVAVDLLL